MKKPPQQKSTLDQVPEGLQDAFLEILRVTGQSPEECLRQCVVDGILEKVRRITPVKYLMEGRGDIGQE